MGERAEEEDDDEGDGELARGELREDIQQKTTFKHSRRYFLIFGHGRTIITD